jgi:hypothetical protein
LHIATSNAYIDTACTMQVDNGRTGRTGNTKVGKLNRSSAMQLHSERNQEIIMTGDTISRRSLLKAGACTFASTSGLLRAMGAVASEDVSTVIPFEFHAPQSALDDLKLRLDRTLPRTRNRCRLVRGRAAGQASFTREVLANRI